jgi:hypothetical protein
VMFAQLQEYMNKHWIVYLKRVDLWFEDCISIKLLFKRTDWMSSATN